MGTHKKFESLTEEQRAEVLEKLVDGEYYPIPADLILSCAMPIALGALIGYPRSEIDKVGIVLGVMSSTCKLACNGVPIFYEVRIILRKDWDIIIEAYRRYEVRKQKEMKEAFKSEEELGGTCD